MPSLRLPHHNNACLAPRRHSRAICVCTRSVTELQRTSCTAVEENDNAAQVAENDNAALMNTHRART